MKKRILSLALCLCLCLSLLPTVAGAATFAGGSGTEEDPYLIATLDQLMDFRDEVNGGNDFEGEAVALTDDIDLGGEDNPWTPIGINGAPFMGTFDGGGYEITGLYINSGTEDDQGLFGFVSINGTVKDLGVAGTVIGGQRVGGVVGCNSGTTENCHYSGAVLSDGYNVGGVVGYNDGAVTGCYNTGTVLGDSSVGGVVGGNFMAPVTNCYNTGEVEGSYNVGGVAGSNDGNGGTVKNCYNIGAVSGDRYAGGVVGGNGYDGTVENCYYLAGKATGGIDDSDIAGQAESKTAQDFKDQSGFTDWNLTTVWIISDVLGRPILLDNPEPEPELEPEAKWGADADSLDGEGPLLEALDAAKDGGAEYIRLVADVTAPDEQTFTATAGEFTLDLNGHTLTGGKGKENAQEDPTLQTDYELSEAAKGKTGLTIDGASVTLTDTRKSGGVTGGTGGYYSHNDSDHNGRGGIGVDVKSGELTVESGVTLTTGDPGSRYADLTLGLSALSVEGGTVTLNGGTYDSRAKTVGDATQSSFIAIDVCGSEADLTVPEGADVTAMGDGGISIALDSGTVDIAAGSFTGELYGLAINSSELTATVQLSGGAYTATKGNGCAVYVLGSVTHAELLAEGYCFADGDGDPVADGDLATAKTLTVVNPSTPEPPTVIPDLATLELFRDCVNKGETYEGETVTLTADIDLGGSEDHPWEPIGMDGAPFMGTFDGGGHTITGLYIDSDFEDNQGLFGLVFGGAVKNLGVAGTVTGQVYVGGVVGENFEGTVENCYYTGTVWGYNHAGGVVGENFEGTVANCYCTGTVRGDCSVGGVVGGNFAGIITDCYNTGEVEGNFENVGGVAGNNGGNGTVKNCYNIGAVSGDEDVGGVVGRRYDGAVTNCYYLDTCGAAGDGAGKTAARFASGEVAHLLQGDQEAQAWGQTLGTDGHPLLTAEAAKQVYKVTFQVDSEEYAVVYANTDDTVALPTDDPTPPEGYQFDKWAIGSVSGEGFTANTPITQDLTVYAVMRDVTTHTHDWAANWAGNDTHHWHQCAADGCDVAEDSGKDSYGAHTYSGYETSDAQHWQKCSVCQRETAKADHTWDKGVVTAEPTLEAEGVMTYTCAVCGETKTQPMDKLTPTATPSRPHYRPVTAAQPVEQAPAVWPFTDVTEQDWCYEGVKYVYEKELMVGTDETHFSPDLGTSRAMAATILWRMAGSPETETALPYPDCEADSWYAAAVAWGTEQGVVKGYGDGSFGPNDPITREQMALMLWRYAGSPETTGTLSAFADGFSVSPWVFPAMEWAVEQGILQPLLRGGRSDSILNPQGRVFRDEAADMLQRFCAV